MEALLPIGILFIMAVTVCLGIYLLATLLGPKAPNPAKESTYECGVEPEGSARTPFTMNFYLIAVLFLLFDIEAAFFLPWALVYRDSLASGGTLLLAMFVYLFFLVLALFYVFRKDYLGLK